MTIDMDFLKIVDNQSGYFQVIQYLRLHGKGHLNKMSADLSIGNTTLYRVFDLLRNKNIITVEESRGKGRGIRKNYYLTDKGKRVAEKLVEMIEEIKGIE